MLQNTDKTPINYTACCTLADLTHKPTIEAQKIKNTKRRDYSSFLKTKHKSIIHSGFEINESELNPMLFDFQKFTVKRALRAGKYAIFADTGQGKNTNAIRYCKPSF